MRHIPVFLRKLVIRRACNRCEYCLLSQEGQEATFHIDHVIPVAEGGQTVSENLALACVSCSLRKGARKFVRREDTGVMVSIYNPRTDEWNEHFKWKGFLIEGISPTGTATVQALGLNRRLIVSIREEEYLLGRHPKQ